MFSKLRPNHRRGGSTPTSPSATQVPTSFPQPPSSSHGPTSGATPGSMLTGESPSPFFFTTRTPEPSTAHGQTPGSDPHVSLTSPSLPPIPRVASVYGRSESPEEKFGLGLSLQTSNLARVRSSESQESKSPSPILPRQEDYAGYDQSFQFRKIEQQRSSQDGTREERYHSGNPRPGSAESSSIRSPVPAAPLRREGVSASQFRSIIQGKHLPPLPNGSNAPRKPHELTSPPPVPLPADSHQVYSRPGLMTLGSQSSSSRQASSSSLASRNTEKSGKKGLHILKSMALLSKRRGQSLEPLPDESLNAYRAHSMSPSSYDKKEPFIRGTKVHEFGTSQRTTSSSTLPSVEDRREGGKSAKDEARYERAYTPVFTENFDDDVTEKETDDAIRAENLANKEFISRNSFHPPETDDDPLVLPPFARVGQKTVYKPANQENLGLIIPPAPSMVTQTIEESFFTSSPLSPLMEDPVSPLEEDDDESDDGEATPKRDHMAKRSRPPTREVSSARSNRVSRMSSSSGLPAHMFSRASRFSFQYANTDSAAQEQMLEQRHRDQQAKALADGSKRPESSQIDGEEDFDFDDMDAFDGMDDDVPMAGEDDWEFGGGGLGINNMTIDDMASGTIHNGLGLGNMTLEDLPSSAGATSVPVSTSSPAKESPSLEMQSDLRSNEKHRSCTSQSSSSTEVLESTEQPTLELTEPTPITRVENAQNRSSDEFYFDNGGFDDADFDGLDSSDRFDESLFDDPNSELFERKKKNVPPLPRKSSSRATARNTLRNRERPKGPSEPLPEHPDVSVGEEHVNAYHSALAMAATKAEAAGRFERAGSAGSIDPIAQSSLGGPVQDKGENGAQAGSSQAESTANGLRSSQCSSMSLPVAHGNSDSQHEVSEKSVNFMYPDAAYEGAYTSDWDCSDYDSAFEDDVIAAANAEALENDDEGLYGTEFGFYARPGSSDTDASDSSQYGGFFGPKTWGEVKRQRSTREPNLTPITERSEYSTRNSFIGAGFAEHDRGLPSPALATLARMSTGWEGNLNMETLMKLRRGAWGGSQGSVGRRSPNPASSPMNSSPNVPKSDPRAMWSSPMSRQFKGEVPGDDADDEGDYEEYLDEANKDQGGEDDEEEGDGGPWPDDDETDENALAYAGDVSPEDDSPLDDSPTLRAAPHPPYDSSVSPIRLSPPFIFPAPSSPTSNLAAPPSLSSPTTASTSSIMMTGQTTATSTPLTGAQHTSQRNSLVASISPLSPAYKPGHSRSGSDSVAYVKERDHENGEFRWVLERRRTGEDGVESVVDRTPIEGGRI